MTNTVDATSQQELTAIEVVNRITAEAMRMVVESNPPDTPATDGLAAFERTFNSALETFLAAYADHHGQDAADRFKTQFLHEMERRHQ